MKIDAWNPTDETVPFLIDRFALPYATDTHSCRTGVDGSDLAARSHRTDAP